MALEQTPMAHRNGAEPQDRERVLDDLAARIGARGRDVLARLPTPELLYLARRRDLQERYADPARGRSVMEWEMSAVERGEQAAEEITRAGGVVWRGAPALDVGCGDGGFLVAFARRGARPYGLDSSEGNLAGANERAGAWGLAVETAVGSALSLPYRNASFEVATCGDVLEHVSDPGAALRELARVLRPGGILWLAAPTRFQAGNVWRDPHYGFFGLTLLPPRAAAWYLTEVRRVLASPSHYAVERLPTYGATVARVRNLGFEILAGEYRPLAALRDPRRVETPWKRRFLERCVALGLRGPLSLLYRGLAELGCPIRLVCRKQGRAA